MTRSFATLLIGGPLIAASLAWTGTAEAQTVNCNAPGASIQRLIDSTAGPTTIFVTGTCTGDVSITRDDITLSGNRAGLPCDRADPGGTGAIEGTVTVDGVRSRIEFLTITGSGAGVDIINRANVHLTCNDISANEAYGIGVLRASNVVLRHNTLSGNGTRTANPFIFFDAGIFIGDASSALSLGNTYADNQYAAIDVGRQSTFRNGTFLPHEPGHPADPDERDVIVERGCDPASGAGCMTSDFGPVAIDVFNGGLVDLRNADVSGEIDNEWQSSFRVDGNTSVQGIIHTFGNSIARLRDRSHFGDREVTFDGRLECDDSSGTFSSEVKCGQTCDGAIPGTCAPTP